MSDVRRDLESIGWREKRIALLESILQGLIAELRDKHRRDPYASDPHCLGCADWPHWPCEDQARLDRAEARLREVTE